MMFAAFLPTTARAALLASVLAGVPAAADQIVSTEAVGTAFRITLGPAAALQGHSV